MEQREVSIAVPKALFEESARRLRGAGVAEPEALLEAALAASATDALETVGGVGPVPTALSDVRAARLLELCKARKEILPDEVVAVLFRVMPTTAGSITRRMQATYEAGLEESLRAHMVASAKLSYPPKEKGAPARHKVTFSTAAAFGYAMKTIAAAGLTGEVSEDRAKRSIEFPQEIDGRDGRQKIQIARDILELG